LLSVVRVAAPPAINAGSLYGQRAEETEHSAIAVALAAAEEGYYAVEGGDTGRRSVPAVDFETAGGRSAAKAVCPALGRGEKMREATIPVVCTPAFSRIQIIQ
jgi:hypothetical protein